MLNNNVDLKKLSDVVVEKEVVKKDVYDELVKKVYTIQTADTGNLVIKANYYRKIEETEKKIINHDHN